MNSSFLKKALPHIIAVLVFLVVAIVYCKPALEGKVVYQSDVLQWKAMAQQSAEFKEKHGHYPLWTESAFSGMPGYTIDMDSRSKISIGYAYYILSLGLPQPVGLFFMACIVFYLLALVLRINPWIGILSALAYAYSTYDPIVIVTGHLTKMFALCYAPGVIAGLFLIFQRKYLWGAVFLSIFFGLQSGTQHLQIVYYTLLTAACLTIAWLITCWKQQQIKSAVIGLAVAAAAGILGFATSSITTLPLQEYTKETMRGGRTEMTNADPKQENKSGLSKDYAFQWSYGIGETLTLAVPGIYGGGSGGKEIGEGSKFAEKLGQEFSVPEDQALQYANGSAYWGAQPFTSGPVYLGAIICFLFIFGLVYFKGWQKWGLLAAVVVSILLAWGKNFPSLNYFLFDYLPFYNKFRAPAMSLVMVQLAFPLLGALALNQLLFGNDSKELIWQKFKTSAMATAGLALVLVAFYFMADFRGAHDNDLKERFVQGKMQQLSQGGKQNSPEFQQQANETGNALIKALQADRQSLYGGDLLRTMLLLVVAVGLVGLFAKGKIKPVVLLAVLIIASTYDLLAVATRYLNSDSYVDAADFETSLNATAADMQIKNDPDKNFRVFDESSQSPFEDARPSYHHNSIGGYSPAKLGLYQDLIEHQLSRGNMQVYNMLNTKYFIQRNPANNQPEARLNPGAFGPCWLVKSIHYVKDGNEEMKALDSINVRDTAIVQQKFAGLIKFMPEPDTTASIHIIENLNDLITYKFSSKSNQFAVFSEIYYDKGWNAYIDGKQADYCRVDYVLRGMAIPAGDHTIEFRFEPRSYATSDAIATWSHILTILLLIGAVVYEFRKKNKQA